jgi:hypothetical protein
MKDRIDPLGNPVKRSRISEIVRRGAHLGDGFSAASEAIAEI